MATTTNYAWETPDDTDLVKDGAAAIRTLGSSIDTTTKALNPSTTLGDIEYRSSTANTNTRLGIGSNGQVLTVASGVPSWASAVATNYGCRLTKSANQTISTATWTAITFDTETFDTSAYHDNVTNPSRITIPSGKAGYYAIDARWAWDHATLGGYRFGRIMKNGAQYNYNAQDPAPSANRSTFALNDVINLAVGDYIEIEVLHNAGSSITISSNAYSAGITAFSVQYLGA